MRKNKKESRKMELGKVIAKATPHPEGDISDLKSKTVYNNYVRSMKEINGRRVKEGKDAIPVRSIEEWMGD